MHVAGLINSTILFHSVDVTALISVLGRRIEKETCITQRGGSQERDGPHHGPESLHIQALPFLGDVCDHQAARDRSLTKTYK